MNKKVAKKIVKNKNKLNYTKRQIEKAEKINRRQ